MKRIVGDHPDVTVNFYVDATSFGRGHKFNLPDFKEPIEGVERNKDRIVIVGKAHTKCSISASETLLDRIQTTLRDFIGRPIGDVDHAAID